MSVPFPGAEHRPFVMGGSARKLLLVHGFPGTPAEMRPLAEALAGRGWEAHGLLLPGFGPEIATLGRHRWQDWLAAVESHLAQLRSEADEVALLGHSLGGALAVVAAAGRHPPDRLVLTAPFTRLPDPRAALLPLLRFLIPKLRPFERADFGDPAIRSELGRMLPGADLDDPEVQRGLRRDIALPSAALEQLRRAGAAATRQAPRVCVPSHVLQGRNDTTVLFTATRRLVSRLGGTVAYREVAAGHGFVLAGSVGHEELLTQVSLALG